MQTPDLMQFYVRPLDGKARLKLASDMISSKSSFYLITFQLCFHSHSYFHSHFYFIPCVQLLQLTRITSKIIVNALTICYFTSLFPLYHILTFPRISSGILYNSKLKRKKHKRLTMPL